MLLFNLFITSVMDWTCTTCFCAAAHALKPSSFCKNSGLVTPFASPDFTENSTVIIPVKFSIMKSALRRNSIDRSNQCTNWSLSSILGICMPRKIVSAVIATSQNQRSLITTLASKAMPGALSVALPEAFSAANIFSTVSVGMPWSAPP